MTGLTRAQRRWEEANAGYQEKWGDAEPPGQVVAAGRGQYRRAARVLARTGAEFVQVVSRRGALVSVVDR